MARQTLHTIHGTGAFKWGTMLIAAKKRTQIKIEIEDEKEDEDDSSKR